MQLPEKQKTFSDIFLAVSKSLLKFNHLPKKGDTYSSCIPGKTGPEKHD